MATERDMGAVSSYAEARIGGYTGTVAQWRSLLANLPQEPYCATVGRDDEYDKCWTAFSARRVVFAQFLISVTLTALPLTRLDANDVMYFTGVIGGKLITWTLTDQNIWSMSETALATSSDIPTDADEIGYDNTVSGLVADDVQEAIDELAGYMDPTIYTAEATFDASGVLTSMTITSGETNAEIYTAGVNPGKTFLIVDGAIYSASAREGNLTGKIVFSRTTETGLETFTLKAKQTGMNPIVYSWGHTVTELVDSISASSTDSEYPSAKCVYDLVGDVESLLAAI